MFHIVFTYSTQYQNTYVQQPTFYFINIV